ncbi:MAG: TPM domain-containing protein [Methanomassiliicoccus sp.]|nr:TPM domain-containing protein [Methanomassiliicoccus sp.]
MRSSTRTVVGLVVLVVMIGGTISAGYILLRPSSGSGDDASVPQLEYYVTDLADAITDDDEHYIGQLCLEVDSASGCEMVVLVVNTTSPSDIDYYALRTFQHNGIGKSGSDNGLLVVVATDDHAWRIEVGYGLEGVLTDVRVNRLAEEFLVPNMTADSYGDGLFELTYALGDILITEYEGSRSGDPAFPVDGVPLTWGQMAIVAVVFIVLVIVTRGMVLRPLIWLLAIIGGGRGGFGGGRSGGGGASGGG